MRLWTEEERVLITTLTKRMAEDLTDYLAEVGIKVSTSIRISILWKDGDYAGIYGWESLMYWSGLTF